MQMEVNLHSAGSIRVFPTIEINQVIHKEHILKRLELRPRQDSPGRNRLNSEPRAGRPHSKISLAASLDLVRR